jgi:hypothetical protein
MRFKFERSANDGPMLRILTNKWTEIAYVVFGLHGLQLIVEFPSDWYEHRLGWVRIGLGFMKVCFAFPWFWYSKDEGQCSGHQYGFHFYHDMLWIRYGKDKGKRTDPHITVYMPWHWRHIEHKILGEKTRHGYTYTLKNGQVQHRIATINPEQRTWKRWWLPHTMVIKSIEIAFDDEVGERTGSWKGGTVGCSHEMLPDETPAQTLRRMERERKL